MDLDPVHVTWLSLVRHQADVAVEQSRQPMPLAMLAVNGLHDAAESLVNLIIEVRSLTVQKKATFEQLHTAVRDEYPALAHHGLSLDRLNTARANYKHHGAIVDSATIERARLNILDFLSDATREGLDLDFDQVSMSGLIVSEPVREMVDRAEQRWQAGDARESMGDLRRAFDRLCNIWEDSKSVPGMSGFYDTRPWADPAIIRQQPVVGLHGDPVIKHHERWLQQLDQRMKLMTFGVDMRRYIFFDVHVPPVRHSWHDQSEGETYLLDGTPPATDDIFRRCHRFVIDTALQFARDDFTWNPAEHAVVKRLFSSSPIAGPTT